MFKKTQQQQENRNETLSSIMTGGQLMTQIAASQGHTELPDCHLATVRYVVGVSGEPWKWVWCEPLIERDRVRSLEFVSTW